MKKLSLLFLFILLMFSCGKRENKQSAGSHQHPATPPDNINSPEHLNHAHQQNTNNESRVDEVLKLDKHQLLKANINTTPAELKPMNQGLRLLGIAAINEQATEVISAQVSGRIVELFLKTPQSFIVPGQALFGVYSEQLQSDINDYLISVAQKDVITNKELAQNLVLAARQRLIQSGVSVKQLNAIRNTNKIPPYIIYYSPVAGLVSNVFVRQGQYVETGMPLFKVSNLNTLWIEARVYPGELNLVSANAIADVEFEAYPGRVYSGKVVFTKPAFETNRKVNLVRIGIDNPAYFIKPGMMATITILRKSPKKLVIPKAALVAQKMTMVWVETGSGIFERRRVSTGIENKREVEILSGLKEGKRVVTTGSYLLNSEYVLQKGSNAMAGMDM